ncbi:MAG: hypothetical protein ACOYLS_07735 [Polymorphobacter sp.]
MRIDFQNPETGSLVTAPQVPAPAATAAPAPPLSFDIPRRVLRQLVLAAAGYLAVMATAFRAGEGIGIIFVVFGVVLVGYYGLPIVMARASGARGSEDDRRGAWGVDTASGYLTGRAAWAQIMTVPLLMLAWAVFIAFLM